MIVVGIIIRVGVRVTRFCSSGIVNREKFSGKFSARVILEDKNKSGSRTVLPEPSETGYKVARTKIRIWHFRSKSWESGT